MTLSLPTWLQSSGGMSSSPSIPPCFSDMNTCTTDNGREGKGRSGITVPLSSYSASPNWVEGLQATGGNLPLASPFGASECEVGCCCIEENRAPPFIWGRFWRQGGSWHWQGVAAALGLRLHLQALIADWCLLWPFNAYASATREWDQKHVKKN